ncbi:MAG: T9SS type A sorting domain-containing protein, partial [Saprospiraceae bacterium]|nr:T9SS type A sorting domain-containing protein [Saprospiraceae bacterium]
DKETSKERLIQIVDMQGKIVAKFVAQAPKTSINLLQLPQGGYFVNAAVEGIVYKTEKLILRNY